MGFRVSEFDGKELSKEMLRLKGLVKILAVANHEASTAQGAQEKIAARAVGDLTRKTIQNEVWKIPKKPISAWVVISILGDYTYYIWDTYVRYDDAKKSIFSTEYNIIVPASILHNLAEELESLRNF
jgi:hypothetical protein